MRIFIPTTQDATIFEQYPYVNTGLDELLEVGKTIKPLDQRVAYASGSTRVLIQFDVPSNQQYPTSAVYYLNLRLANASNVNRYQKLEVYPVSSSWIEGSGYFYQTTINTSDGVTWQSASKDESWLNSGSDYTTDVTASYTFTKVPIEDVRINVTDILSQVVSGSNITPWNGLLIKFPTVDELDTTNIGNIKFFSSNTHTVFAPKLEVAYFDQTFNTGSLKPIPAGDLSIIPKNLKEAYTVGEIDKIYLVVRDKFPDKRFDAVQRYRTQYYLPSSSYFRIKDSVSGVVLYDFDQYSTINCDVSGSYINLDTTALDLNRYYTIDLKVQTPSRTFFPEFEYEFKVDRDG